MGGPGNIIRRWSLAVGVSIIASLAGLSLPAAAGYPRQIAIASFVSQSQDNVAPVAGILPRLLASRLMAIAGAEVVVLPPGETPPAEAARAANVPLLLQGTVSKLGKGYSIDVTALDLATGRTAGAFFAAAATEDEIIARLGDLAAEAAETLFDVKPKVRAAPPPSVPASSTAALPVTAPAAPASPKAVPAAAAAPAAPPSAPGEIRVPASLKKVSHSDKILEEIYGVVAGDVDGEGNGEVLAYGRRTIHVYKVKGTELLPYTRVTRGANHHFLNVEAVDVDGDGKKELLVTDLVGDVLQSFVLRRAGDTYEETAAKIPLFLVVLPDWNGKRVVVGQRLGFDTAFTGKVVTLAWDGKTLKEGEELLANTNAIPSSAGIPGLSSARLGQEWRLLYMDESDRLQVLTTAGKSEYRSKTKYGSPADSFDWGTINRLEGKRPSVSLRKALRPFPGEGLPPLFLTTATTRSRLPKMLGADDTSRMVLLRWDGAQFVEAATTLKSDSFYTGGDILAPPRPGRKGTVIAAIIEQFGDVLSTPTSRLEMIEAE